jgi:hypothetical protein
VCLVSQGFTVSMEGEEGPYEGFLSGGNLFPSLGQTSVFGGARGGLQGVGGSSHGRDGGKNNCPSHVPAWPGSLVPRVGLGGTRNECLESFVEFSEPVSKGLSEREWSGQELR